MSEKVWVKLVLFGTMAILGIAAAFTIVIDPFFHFHAPLESLEYPIHTERYQNDGIMKHFEYDALLTGTSMSQNFKTSEFDALFGTHSIKVPFAAGRYKEVGESIERAIEANPDLKIVLRGMDYYFLAEDKDTAAYETYPEYLYDKKPFNDVYYILNKEVLIYHTLTVLDYTRAGNLTTTFDAYGNWNADYTFGKEAIFQSFVRSPQNGEELELTDEERVMIEENIGQNIVDVAQRHPEVTFYVYIPPYSILYWDSICRQGKLEWHIQAEQTAIEKLLECGNVRLFSFTDKFDVITNLDNYKDDIHYSQDISSALLQWMADENGLLTKENYKEYLERIKEFYKDYDYDSLYE